MFDQQTIFNSSIIEIDHTTPTLTTDVTLQIFFHHPVDFFFDKCLQFRRFEYLDIGAVTKDGFDQFAEIGDREMQGQAAVGVDG